MKLIDGSKTDAFLQCATSALKPDEPYNPSGPLAGIGHAVHELLAMHVGQQQVDDSEIEAVAIAHNADPGEVGMLFHMGRKEWDKVKDWFSSPMCEVELTGKTARGRCDILSADESSASLLDWKTGHVELDHRGQMATYALCHYQQHGMPMSGRIRAVVVFVRLGIHHVYDFTEADLRAHNNRLIDQSDRVGSQYAPGLVCTYCQRQLICKARVQWLHSATQSLEPIPDSAALTDNTLADLYPKAKMLKQAIARYEQALDRRLLTGPLDLGEGQTLSMQETKRSEIDPLKAWPVMQQHLSDQEIAETVKVGKAKLEKALAAKAPRGQKGKFVKAIIGGMEEAGAITKRVEFRKVVRGRR